MQCVHVEKEKSENDHITASIGWGPPWTTSSSFEDEAGGPGFYSGFHSCNPAPVQVKCLHALALELILQ